MTESERPPGGDRDDGDRDGEDAPDGTAEPDRPPAWDAEFDAIVAGLDLQLPEAEPTVPDDPGDRPSRPGGPGSFEELRAWIDVHPDLLAEPPDDEEPEDDDSAHYVPPSPPPVPRGDRVSRWAWAGAVGGPVGYVTLSLLGVDVGGVLGVTLVGAFVGGFVTLVYRMKDGPRAEDDPDDGAVV